MTSQPTARNGRRGAVETALPAILLVLLGCLPAEPPENPTHRPNVLVITADTTRHDVLGCYGGAAATPAIDALAEDGVLFHNAFSNAFGTTPSHASLWTASPAAQHGVYDNESILASGHVTLAEVLREAGYTTAAFVGAKPVSGELGLDQGFDVYDQRFVRRPGDGLGKYARHERRADTTVDHFLRWLEMKPGAPFFAWLHFYDPHQPYAPLDFQTPPGSLFVSSAGEAQFVRLTDEIGERVLADPELLAAVQREGKARYRAEIEHVDRHLGRAFKGLMEKGLYDETLVVFTADHGESFAEHDVYLLFKHATVLDNVSRLPLIFKLPQSRRAGSARRFLVGSVDVAPTILDVIGVAPPDGWAGRSFRRLLEDTDLEFRDYVVLEGAHGHEIAVRTHGWLYREIADPFRGAGDVDYLRYRAEPFELYRIGPDGSMHADDDPAKLSQLGDVAQRFQELRQDDRPETLNDPDHLEALKALGYIQPP